MRVGDRLVMTFGKQDPQGRVYRGYWGSSDRRIIIVRQWRGMCETTCAEVEALAPGDAVVLFRLEGGLMDWSNEIRVE